MTRTIGRSSLLGIAFALALAPAAIAQETGDSKTSTNATAADDAPIPVFRRPGFERPGEGRQAEGTDEEIIKRRSKSPLPPALAMPDYNLVGLPDRWRLVEALGVNEKPWDPYNQSTLKGDRPIFGTDDWFMNLQLISDTVIEPRRIPVPAGIAVARGTNLDIFGQGEQLAINQNWIASISVFQGDTAFKPPEWEFRVTGVANINYLKTEEDGLVNANPQDGDDRFDYWFSLLDAFAERHLWDRNDRYDFDSLRVGIQPFISDFRGFLLDDANLGARLFGTFVNNRIQYNVAYFRRIEKDINSGLPKVLDLRDDNILMANAYYEDFPVLGFTLQGIVAYNWNRETDIQVDKNRFRQRPAPFGNALAKDYDVVYLGLNGDGHFDRLNFNFSFYYAVGDESLNQVQPFPLDSTISAFFAAAEASVDFDWARVKAFGLFGSGDDDPYDNHSAAFDSIFDNPNFAGAETSYWIRQTIPLVFGGGVTLSGRNSVINSLRTSKDQGQSNFVNPGIGLVGVGTDLDILPQLRLIGNFSWLTFVHTQPLELLRQQPNIHKSIGFDLSGGIIYRPLFIENVVLQATAAFLVPGKGLKDLYPDNDLYYSAVANIILTY